MDNLKLYNGLPLMEAKMNEDDTGIYCVSFVSDPATEIGWVTFADEKETVKFAIENEKEHIVSGIIMVASTPIYRIDSYGAPYYIIYSKDTLKYMAEKMLKEGFTSSADFVDEFPVPILFRQSEEILPCDLVSALSTLLYLLTS